MVTLYFLTNYLADTVLAAKRQTVVPTLTIILPIAGCLMDFSICQQHARRFKRWYTVVAERSILHSDGSARLGFKRCMGAAYFEFLPESNIIYEEGDCTFSVWSDTIHLLLQDDRFSFR